MPLAALLAALPLFACVAPTPGEAPPVPAAAPPEPGTLRVRLVFGPEADLDLYVSGPALETVYFANPTSRDGGALLADRRCDAAAPRVETVVFDAARPARYRVGVDFMVRCRRRVDEAPYTLVIEAPDREPLVRRGVARFGVFDAVALELAVGASDAP